MSNLTVMQDDISLLATEFQGLFPLEFCSEAEKIVFCCIILNRWGEGAYDNENDI